MRSPIAKTATRTASSGAAKVKTVNLALQGGGSHGAYTWGVLDALSEDERIALARRLDRRASRPHEPL